MKQPAAKAKNGKYGIGLFAALALSVLLSSCLGQKGDKPSSQEAKPQEPVEIVFYSTLTNYYTSYEKLLAKRFPDYKFIYLDGKANGLWDVMMTSKTHFDIFQSVTGSYYQDLLRNRIEFDMTELAKQHKVDLNRLNPSFLDGPQQAYNNQILGFPLYTSLLITYYNKDLFDKFGAQYPKAGYTWDDLYEMSKKLSRNEGGTAYSGYTPNFQYMLDMNPYSIPSVDVKTTKPTINTDPRWQQFFRTLVIPPSQSDVGIKERKPAASQPWKDLIGGTQALFVYSSSPLAAATSYWPGHRIDVTTAPVFKDNSKLQGSMPFGQYVGITKMAKNKDAAMEVVKYLLSDEVQTVQARSGNIPVVTTRAVWDELGKETADWSRSLNWEALRKATMAPIPVTGVFERSVNTVYAKYASQVMFGELDMNTAFRLAEEEAQKAIDSLKEGYVQGIAY